MTSPGEVQLEVYDVNGRLVRALPQGTQTAGMHSTTFEAERLPSGTYLYRLITPDGTRSKSMILAR